MSSPDDEDEDVQVEQQDDDEDREPGSESEGASGQDTAGRDEDSDLSPERAVGDETPGQGASSERSTPHTEVPQRGGRYQRLANENREYRERLERLERDRENERQQWQRQQAAVNEAQERDRLALMTPDERTNYLITQDRQQRQTEMQQFRMQTAMQIDKSNYDAKAVNNPVYRRMADQVEAMFQEQLRKGSPTDRETILYHLLGKQAVNGASSARPRQQARRRVENERVAPSSGKGDMARRSEGGRRSTAEERLKDVLI